MKKIKVLIKRAFNIKNGFFTSMILTISFVCILSASYAFFTASAERKGALNIVSGSLYSLISSSDINEEKAITINSGRTRTIKVKLTNVNGIDAKFNFYYSSTSNNIEIGYSNDGDSCPTEEGVTLPKNGDDGDTKTFTIEITNNDSSPVTITFGSKVGLTSQDLEFPNDKHTVPKLICRNEVIDVDGLPANKCKEKQYNDEDADKSAMFVFSHDETDQTPQQTEYRYIGDEPNNYVTFNEETWRIIGVFNVQSTESGEYEQRIKIVRDSLENNRAWDDTPSNNWSRPSTLNSYLNNEVISGNFWDTYIKGTVGESQIDNVKWYTAGHMEASGLSAETFYKNERGSSLPTSSGAQKNWIGKVGLIYPSDYGYTYAKGVDDTCYSDLYSCGTTIIGTSDVIATKGWIYNTNNTSTHTWLLSPVSGNLMDAFYVSSTGFVYVNGNVGFAYSVRPVLYLKSNIQITGGDGSEGNPYTLSES